MKAYRGTGYKALFECIKELGIEAVINYMEGLKYIEQNSLKGTDAHLRLKEINRVVKEYVDKNESITLINPASKLLSLTLKQLSENISLLESYLENARRIEALKVRKIDFFEIQGEYL